jgi:LAGLIDADG DNA endonuclease family protein
MSGRGRVGEAGATPRKIVVRILTAVERAWLAGVIDGEGSILISRIAATRYSRRGFFYKPKLEVANSNKEFVDRVLSVIGKGSVNLCKEKNPEWKDKWQYNGASGVLRGILPQILPHLLVKRAVAEKMLEYLSFAEDNPIDGAMDIPPGHDEKVDSLYWAVKELNQKGKDPPRDELLLASKPFNPNNRRPGNRVRACRQLSETERAWLAGVIDGEGSIFLSKVFDSAYRRGFYYLPQLLVSNSNRLFLIKIAEVVGEGTVHRQKKGEKGAKTRWAYIATAGVLRAILPQILPYMIVKQGQSKKMLEYFEFIDHNPIWGRTKVEPNYYERLDSLYFAMKKLNEKGRPLAGVA